jgi:hypothetical protein
MSEYITFKELLTRWEKQDFELLEFFPLGLKPYNKVGHPLPCPSSKSSYGKLKEKLIDLENKYNLVDSERITGLKTKLLSELPAETKDKETIIKNKLMDKKNEIILMIKNIEHEKNEESHTSWKYFIIPDTEVEIVEIITYLEKSFFKLLEIKKFEKDHDLIKPHDIDLSKHNARRAIDNDVAEMLNTVRPETELLYSAIRSVGISDKIPNREKLWHDEVCRKYEENVNDFKYIKESFLKDEAIYLSSNPKRDFIGRLLKKIFYDKGLKPNGARELYTLYKKTK